MAPILNFRLRSLFAITMCCGVLAANSGCSGSTDAPVATIVSRVAVAPSSLNLEVGASATMTATVLGLNGATLPDRTVTWTSDKPAVATISSSGVVNAVSAGTALVTGAIDGVSASSVVVVTTAAVAAIAVTPSTLNLAVGGTAPLTATTTSASGVVLTGRVITWSSSANNIATVTQAGIVSAVAAGSATITASSEGRSATTAVTVAPPAPAQAVFASIAPGGNHTCALDAAGKAYCWGANNLGALGNGSNPTNPHIPLLVNGGLPFASIASGMYHTCALTATGVAYCWGWNIKGQLGEGTLANRDVPTLVNTDLRFTSITAGGQAGGEHTCALTAAGAAYCWGWNVSGQLGDNTTTDKLTPVAVSGGLTFTSISAGNLHTCALTAAGKPYCWGAASEIGEGGSANRSTPTAVSGNLTLRRLDASWWSTCGITTTDATYCWGLSSTTTSALPTLVPTLVFANVASGNGGMCGLLASGEAHCTGVNTLGQVGDGTSTTRTTLVPVSGGLRFAKIAMGNGHACALTATGLAYCWGGNEPGQVGDGSQTNRLVPVAVRAP